MDTQDLIKEQRFNTSRVSIASFCKKILSQPINDSIILLPAYQNTHIANCRYAYMEETVHFSPQGQVLKRYTAEACQSQIDMLSQYEVVMLKSIMKYNGDVRDFIIIWDLRDNTKIQFQFHACYDEDSIISVQLVVFQKSKLICLCEYQWDPTLKTLLLLLTYYEPAVEQGKKIYRMCHRHTYKANQSQIKQECLPTKLNEDSMIGFINYHKQVANISFYVYQYNREKKEGSGKTISLGEQNQKEGIKLQRIWQIGQGKLYVKYTKGKQMQQFIWEWKQNRKKQPTYRQQMKSVQCYQTQFINSFGFPVKANLYAKRYQRQSLTNQTILLQQLIKAKAEKVPINIVYQMSDQQVIGSRIEIAVETLVKKKHSQIKLYSIVYAPNRIIQYLVENDGTLTIRTNELEEFYFKMPELAVWLMTQLIGEGCDDDLLATVHSLLL